MSGHPTVPCPPRLKVCPDTGAAWLRLRTGPDGHVARTIQVNGPGADTTGEVDDPAGKAGGIYFVDYDADGLVCGIEVV